MSIGRNSLVTVNGVEVWIEQGKQFSLRYDWIRNGAGANGPVYNCIYTVADQDFTLVATNARGGFVKDRQLALYPGILASHHVRFGDGSNIMYHPDDQSLSTWRLEADGTATMVSKGKGAEGG